MHVPAVHVPLHVDSSLQSKLQKFEVHCAVHVAESSHRISQGPAVHAMLHFAFRSQNIWQGGAAQRKSHVSPWLHLHCSPQSFVMPPLLVLASVPASAGVPLELASDPLDVPPLPLAVPLELDDGAPLPIVQSYEHAPATMPPTATTEATENRFTPPV